MDDADTLSLMMYGNAPDQQQKAAAMAAALRRNQQGQDYGGMLQAFKGLHPGLADMGADEAKEAAGRYSELLKAPDQGIDYQKGAMALDQASRRNAALRDPTTPLYKMNAGFLKRLGTSVEPDADLSLVSEREEGLMEKAQAHEDANAWRKLAAQTKATSATQPRPLGAKDVDKLSKDFDLRMSASGPRAGAMGIDYQRLQNAQNLSSIIKQPVVTPQMVTEATAALAKLISGGVATEGTMHAMVPNTAGMELSRAVQYIFGHPRDAGVHDFLDYMQHTADREAANANQRIREERLSRLTAHGSYYGSAPDQLKRQAARYHITPEEVDAAFSGAPEAQSSAEPAPQREGLTNLKTDHDAAAVWLNDPTHKSDPNYSRVLAAYKKAHPGT